MQSLPDFVRADEPLTPVQYPKGLVQLFVTNNWVWAPACPPEMLRVFDREFRYPTAIAAAKEAGFVDPEGENGWDGWIRLLKTPKMSPPRFPTGLLGRAMRLTTKHGYQPTVDDRRVRPPEDIPEFSSELTDSLRDYQLEAVRLGEAAGRGVFDMPPRAGKTRMMAELTRRIALPVVWIAPTDRIVSQTLAVLHHFFGESYATHLVGGKEQMAAAKFRIVLCTAATAANLSPEFYATRQVLVMDEFHHAGSKQGETIFKLCENIYYRYGMTGTFFRSGEDELAMRALLSNVIYKVTSLELAKRGYLVPTQVLFIPVMAPRLRGLTSDFQTGHGKHGIHEHDGRNAMVANAAVSLWNAGKRVLILVGTKEQGRRIKALIEPALPAKASGAQYGAVEFCSTDMPRPRIVGAIEAFLAGDVKVIIGTSLLGEGVDLPVADALVYARGEQAEVSLVQNAYRVSTAVEGKHRALIVDFADRHNHKLMRHSHERLSVYHSDPLFQLGVLGHPNEFEPWLKENAKK